MQLKNYLKLDLEIYEQITFILLIEIKLNFYKNCPNY